MDDELVFLGTGGGRHHIRTQHRSTGGILYKFNGVQAHIDPGPGSTIRINQFGENPTDTELFIVTHNHLDHSSDISAIIESSREKFRDENYNLYKKGTLITTGDAIKFISDYHLSMLEKVVEFKPGDKYVYNGSAIIGTKVKHSKIDGFGIRFNHKDYSLAYTSDTMVFEGFSEQYSGVNVLVLNLLRPNSQTCRRHATTDEMIPYLNKISPPLECLVITHFGSRMDGPNSLINHVPSQVKKIKENSNIKHVIGAEDGLKIRINEILKI